MKRRSRAKWYAGEPGMECSEMDEKTCVPKMKDGCMPEMEDDMCVPKMHKHKHMHMKMHQDMDNCDMHMPHPVRLLAHAYVIRQKYESAFCPEEALMKGTLFPELYGVYPIPQ